MHLQGKISLMILLTNIMYGSFLSDMNVSIESLNNEELRYEAKSLNKISDVLELKLEECHKIRNDFLPNINFDMTLFKGYEENILRYIHKKEVQNLFACSEKEWLSFSGATLYFLSIYTSEHNNNLIKSKERIVDYLISVPPVPQMNYSIDNVAKKLPNKIKTYIDDTLGMKPFNGRELEKMYEKSEYYKKYTQKNENESKAMRK